MANQPKKYQKFVATAATATLVATAVVPAASADELKFSDIGSYATEVQAEVEFLADLKVINGFEDGTFKPAQNITRGQAVKMIGRFLVEQDITEVPANWETVQAFDDVSLTHPDRELVKYAAVVKAAGVFQGNGNVLNASGFTTRENMALILDRLIGQITGKTAVEWAAGEDNNVSDLANAKEEARAAIAALNALGVSNAEEFKPKNNTQRVHFASFLARVIEFAESKEVVTSPAIEKATVKSLTSIELALNTAVDEVKAENFTIEGATVTAATLGEDKKTVTLTVTGLENDKSYTVAAKDIQVDGETKDFGTANFTVPAKVLNDLQISFKDASLKADGADNTEVTFKLVKPDGSVDTDADDVVLDLNTTYGTLAQKRVTIQNGVATVLLTSEFSNTNVTAKIDAQIIEASEDYKDYIGKVVATANINFVTTNTDNVNTVTVVEAEANQTDRVTLFFDQDVTLKHFVKTNAVGELLFAINGEGEYTADEVKALGATPESITHVLKNNSVTVTQEVAPNTTYKVKGIKPVANNAKAVEVVLDKSTPLVDNANVEVVVNTENSLNKITKSEVDFKVTDARVPNATSVVAEGLNTLKVNYSEPIANTKLVIDGRHDGDQVTHVSEITDAALEAAENEFLYAFGEFNPATLEDTRHVATVKLSPKYKEDFKGAIGGYFGAGQHTVQTSSTQDFAFATDKNNVGTTQNLTFTIAEDKAKPTATVVVESPEQFRVKFDKSTNLTAAQFEALFTSGEAKVQVYDVDSKEYVDTEAGQLQAADLEFTRVSASEFVIELNKDWTEIYNTEATTKNYYNDKYRLVIAKENVTNVANGLTNDQIVLDLNQSGSALNAADVTSPVIETAVRRGSTEIFDVTMSEPVKLVLEGAVQDTAQTSGDTALDTQAQTQTSQATTTVQFLGTDKDGNAVTFDGTVVGYSNTDRSATDKLLQVKWEPKQVTVDGVKSTITPQSLVNAGGNTEWTIVVRAIADDVGNTAASATFKVQVAKQEAGNSPFRIDAVKDANGAFVEYKVYGKTNGTAEDTVEVTFSEGVQWTSIHDATNPAQYTLNGKTLPEGTSIKVANDDTAEFETAEGYEKVIITLPDGTLNTKDKLSNVITVNKNLTSYDGSVISGATEVTFVADAAPQTP